jgi:peptide deformylase
MNQAGSQEMTNIGIVQEPAAILHEETVGYDLPAEAGLAQAHFRQLIDVADAVLAAHESKKGLGVAAPQVGIARRIAIFRPWKSSDVCLLNPVITERSDATDKRYEGCLSLFDVRGLVSRSLSITVEAQHFDGTAWRRTFTNGAARLIAHEIDHLDGLLYTERMEDCVPIPVAEYRNLQGTDWVYDQY